MKACFQLILISTVLSAGAQYSHSAPGLSPNKSQQEMTSNPLTLSPTPRPKGLPTIQSIEDQVASMTLKQKVGQLFVFGFTGKDTSRAGLLLKRYMPGGFVLFGRNISSAVQVSQLNHQLQKLSLKLTGLPLFLAIDQEGGRVTRIKLSPPLPSGLAIGQTKDSHLTKHLGYFTGNLLRLLGFNMNLAPVMDLAPLNARSFIGPRSYGENPRLVQKLTHSYMRGLLDAHIIPTAKHFPGHGSVEGDSHVETPVSSLSTAELRATHLRPYSNFQPNLMANMAVMVAHINYPKIDPVHPATFSHKIVTGLLRRELGFKGLVITDDIQMSGAKNIGSASERALKAIEAGADLIMVAWGERSQHKIISSVHQAVKTGRLSLSRVDESVRRILLAKQNIRPYINKSPPTPKQIQRLFHSPLLKRLANLVLKRNLDSQIKNLQIGGRLKDANKILVFSARVPFHKGFKEAVGPWKFEHFPLTSNKSFDINNYLETNSGAFAIVHVTGANTARSVNRLRPEFAPRVLLVNNDHPSLIKNEFNFAGTLNLYTLHPLTGKVVYHYLKGLQKTRNLASAPEKKNDPPQRSDRSL